MAIPALVTNDSIVLVGRDAFALSLGYYGDSDYKAIGQRRMTTDARASIAQRPFAPIGMPGTAAP